MGRRGATIRVFKELANIGCHSCSLSLQPKATRDQLIRGIEAIAPPGYLVEDRLKIRPAATGSWWIRPTLGACRTYLIRQQSF